MENWNLTDIRYYKEEWRAQQRAQIASPAFEKEHERSFLKFLVDKGAALNAVNHSGHTPLMVACSQYVLYSVACLHSGADHRIPNDIGLSPLLVSIPDIGSSLNNERLEIAKLLLKHGDDPEASTSSGNRALHIACGRGLYINAALVSALLRHGADVSARGAGGFTPIRIAIQLCRGVEREEIMTQLLAGGADPGERDELQRTALHWACLTRDSFLVRRLLDRKIDHSARDADGNTPLHLVLTYAKVNWAEEPWIEKTIRLLLLKGALFRITF
jgi:ankyrin repeat protein